MFRRRGGGTAGWLSAHPHYKRWLELHALVCDGLAYAAGGGKGGGDAARGQGSGASPLLDTAAPGTKRSKSHGAKHTRDEEKKSKKKSKKEGKKASASGNSGSTEAMAAPSHVAATASESSPRKTYKTTPAGSGGRWVHVTDA